MKLNFFVILDNPKTIKFYDISEREIPEDISYMELTVVSSKLTESYTFNVIDYLTYKREQEELFTLTSDMIGLSPEQNIPDGVYHITYNINGHHTITNKFLVFQNVKEKIEQLLKDSEYKVNVGDYNMTYVDDDINYKYDIEKVRYITTLFDKLLTYTQEPNEVEVNNILDKLTKLLTIINTTI